MRPNKLWSSTGAERINLQQFELHTPDWSGLKDYKVKKMGGCKKEDGLKMANTLCKQWMTCFSQNIDTVFYDIL